MKNTRRARRIQVPLNNGRSAAIPATGYLEHYGVTRRNADVALPSQHPYADKGDKLATIVWRKTRNAR